jgi:predicted  nucleic acid-binding Zn-ribbon protein
MRATEIPFAIMDSDVVDLERQLDEAREVAEVWREMLAATEADLSRVWSALEAAQRRHEAAEEELDEAYKKLAATEAELTAARSEIAASRAELQHGEKR